MAKSEIFHVCNVFYTTATISNTAWTWKVTPLSHQNRKYSEASFGEGDGKMSNRVVSDGQLATWEIETDGAD